MEYNACAYINVLYPHRVISESNPRDLTNVPCLCVIPTSLLYFYPRVTSSHIIKSPEHLQGPVLKKFLCSIFSHVVEKRK
jgi:hypothetical protein